MRLTDYWSAWLLVLVVSAVPLAAGELHAQTPTPGKADGSGGLADLTAEDVQNLCEVREMLKRMAVDPREHLDDQRRALMALGRVHEALNDWGLDNQLQWCLEAMGAANRNKDVLASLAVATAKGGAYHLGGVRELWGRLEDDEGGNLSPEWRRLYVAMERLARESPKRAPNLAQTLRPMALQAKKVDPQTLRIVKVTPKTIDLKGLLVPYKP
jgi:hypothetical protein